MLGCPILHLDRRGIVNDSFRWSFTQTFDAYKLGRGRRAVTNTHPMSDILPVPVRLTKKSSHDPTMGLGHAGQIFRLLKDCVVMLRLFCTKYEPELNRDVPDEISDKSGGSDKDVPDKSDISDTSGGSDEEEDEDEDEDEGADKNEVEDAVHHPAPAALVDTEEADNLARAIAGTSAVALPAAKQARASKAEVELGHVHLHDTRKRHRN